MDINDIDIAEDILRENRCYIKSFLASGTTQYVVKKGQLSISPSFRTIRSLCEWVILHENAIRMEDPK